MTLQEYIIETEMFQYSKENYEMTKLIGEIELYEMAIRSHDLLMSDTVYTEGVDILNLFSEAEDGGAMPEVEGASDKAKETLGAKIKKAWEWICDKFTKMWEAIKSFFTGKVKKDEKTQQNAEKAIEGLNEFADMYPEEGWADDGGNTTTPKKSDPKSKPKMSKLDQLLNRIDMLGDTFSSDSDLLEIYDKYFEKSRNQNNSNKSSYAKGLNSLIKILKKNNVPGNDIRAVQIYFEICAMSQTKQSYVPAYMPKITEMTKVVTPTLKLTDSRDIDTVANNLKILSKAWADCEVDRSADKWVWVGTKDATDFIKSSTKSGVKKVSSGSASAVIKTSLNKTKDANGNTLSNYMSKMFKITRDLLTLTTDAMKLVSRTTTFEFKVAAACVSITDYAEGKIS